MLFIGIDIAKNLHELSIVDVNGDLIDQSFSFSNNAKGFDKLKKYFNRFDVNPSDSIIGMEATGHYWLCLYSYLFDLGYEIVVVNPIQSDAFSKMSIRKIKNDSVDSFYIAQLMRFGNYSPSNIPDEDIFSIKQLSRFRVSLVDECSCWKNKLIAILDQVFPEYSKLFSNVFGVASKEVLSKYPLPDDMLSVSTEELAKLLNKASRGAFGIEKAKQIQDSARNTFGIFYAKETFSFQIKQIINQIYFIEEQIKEIDKKLEEMTSSLDNYLTTITGIGPVLAATIIGEIGDISRFEKPSQLVAYAGLDVSVNESGEYTGTKGKISKRGSPYLRRAIWQAATVASSYDPALKQYYQSLRQRGKPHLVAVGAVARKMTNIIFAILRDNKPYEPHFN